MSGNHRREVAKSALRSRTARLARLLELDAPDVVVCTEVVLILQAAALLNRDELGGILGDRFDAVARRGFGICLDCDSESEVVPDPPKLTRSDYCARCSAGYREREADGEV